MNKFIIFSAGWNSKDYVEKHINSIKNQTYKNYVHVVVDDCTNDGTYDILKSMEYPQLHIHRNETNKKWIYNAVTYLNKHIESDEDIIAIVDLDDWLFHDKVLEQLNNIYRTENVWLTYGSYEAEGKYSEIYSEEELKEKNFRKIQWKFRHLRTFKAFLWNNINKEDLKYNGDWPPYTYDKAIGFPLLEMCPAYKIRHIPEINYYYNTENPNRSSLIKRKKNAGSGLGAYYRSKKLYEIIHR